ncbi:MAG: tetratricopeptide repeat-containing sensor histidine kinase [Bacteroidota bacterium]
MKNIIILISFILLASFLLAQSKLDGIKNKLNSAKSDSSKISLVLDIANTYNGSLPDSAMYYCDIALFIAKKLNYKKGIASCLNYKGSIYSYMGLFEKAIDNYLNSLKLYEELHDAQGMALCYGNIGTLHSDQGSNAIALQYYSKAIKIFEELKDNKSLASCYNGIGNIYIRNNNFEQAIEYYSKSENKYNEAEDKNGVSICKCNIGGVYLAMGASSKVKSRAAIEYKKALEYFLKSLTAFKEIGNNYGLANAYNSIAYTLTAQGKYGEAIEYANKGLSIALGTKDLPMLKSSYDVLAIANDSLQNYKEAYKNQILFKLINDSIFNSEKSRQIADMQVKYESGKKENENEILRQKNEIQQSAIQTQVYIRNTFIYFSIIVTLVVVFLVFRYYIKQKANKLLSEKNDFINKQKDELEEISKMKDKIFAVIMHDLKNPFNTVVTLANFMENEYENMAENQKFRGIQSLNKSVINVDEMLENLLDWLNATKNNLVLHKTCFEIGSTIDSVVKLYKSRAEQKSIHLHSSVQAKIFVFGDERMIKTVLRNLVDNAIKFTFQEGEVNIMANEENDDIIIAIADTGVGIEEDDNEKIFKLDYLYTTKGTDYEKGGGLGLMLSKEFVEKNDGRIWFESELNVGSTFYFSVKKGELYE